MYQSASYTIEGADFVAGTAPAPSAAKRSHAGRFNPANINWSAIDWSNLDLSVDLGDNIGSRAWWRGLATLGALLAITLYLAFHPMRLIAPAQPALSTAQLEVVDSIALAPMTLGSHTGTVHKPTRRVMALSEPPERPRIELTARLRAVDSFNGAMRRAGVSRGDVANAALLLAAHTDVRNLKPGTAFDVVLGRRPEKSEPRPLESLSFRAAFDLRLELARNDVGDLAVTRHEIAVDDTPMRVSGGVGSSLYKSARAAGLSSRVVANYIKALSPRVNFQRDVPAAASFEMIVEHRRAETGETETGDLLYAKLDGARKNIELMRWKQDGEMKYFLADGTAVAEGMIGSPIPGARLSSGFGVRAHPILRIRRMHSGVDYAAGSGTPILSTAPGKVIFAGRNGGYGNQVQIRHNNGMVTTYSHMRGFAVSSGARVSAGQKIGYVGSTGLSTGPHLHYEVHIGGRAVNPRSTKLPVQEKLAGAELERFKAELNRMRNLQPIADSHRT